MICNIVSIVWLRVVRKTALVPLKDDDSVNGIKADEFTMVCLQPRDNIPPLSGYMELASEPGLTLPCPLMAAALTEARCPKLLDAAAPSS